VGNIAGIYVVDIHVVGNVVDIHVVGNVVGNIGAKLSCCLLLLYLHTL
jgi:hypothetical protein